MERMEKKLKKLVKLTKEYEKCGQRLDKLSKSLDDQHAKAHSIVGAEFAAFRDQSFPTDYTNLLTQVNDALFKTNTVRGYKALLKTVNVKAVKKAWASHKKQVKENKENKENNDAKSIGAAKSKK